MALIFEENIFFFNSVQVPSFRISYKCALKWWKYNIGKKNFLFFFILYLPHIWTSFTNVFVMCCLKLIKIIYLKVRTLDLLTFFALSSNKATKRENFYIQIDSFVDLLANAKKNVINENVNVKLIIFFLARPKKKSKNSSHNTGLLTTKAGDVRWLYFCCRISSHSR